MTDKQPKDGLFITIEGVDGSGKTTCAHRLMEYLKANNYKAIYTREPGGCPVSESIRDLVINSEVDKTTEALLFYAARNEHYKTFIKPKLEQGYIVICDRFTASSMVYQGMMHDMMDKIIKLNEIIDNPPVDKTLYITASINTLLSRIHSRADMNRFDKDISENLGKALMYYDRIIANNPKYVKIRNESSVDNCAIKMLSAIRDAITFKNLNLY